MKKELLYALLVALGLLVVLLIVDILTAGVIIPAGLPDVVPRGGGFGNFGFGGGIG